MTCFEFRKMVENKPFVATVYDITKNDAGDDVINISLCDTSGENDVYVAKTLIDKGLAAPRIPLP